MDFDEQEIDAELAAIFGEEDKIEQQVEEIDQQYDADYLELLKLADTHPLILPSVLAQSQPVIDAEHVRFDDLHRYIDGREETTPQSQTQVYALIRLVFARGFATSGGGFNDSQAIEARNEAIGEILALADYGTEEKDSFISFTNQYLSGYVDEFVLPTAIRDDLAPAVKTDFADGVLARRDVEWRDNEIANEIRQETEDQLRSVIGAHDDIKDLSYSINFVSRLMLHTTSFPDVARDELEQKIAGLWETSDVDRYIERIGIERDKVLEIILQTANELKARGYTSEQK